MFSASCRHCNVNVDVADSLSATCDATSRITVVQKADLERKLFSARQMDRRTHPKCLSLDP